MKKFVFVLFLFVSAAAFAQFRQPGRGIPQSQAPRQEFSFNPERAIGIVYYDVAKAAKKIKLKKGKPAYKQFSALLTKFNKEVKDMARINSFMFKQEKQNVEASQKLSVESQDFSILQKAYKQASDTFKPIVDLLTEKEKQLDEAIKPLISEKQFDKWKKYKLRMKQKRP